MTSQQKRTCILICTCAFLFQALAAHAHEWKAPNHGNVQFLDLEQDSPFAVAFQAKSNGQILGKFWMRIDNLHSNDTLYSEAWSGQLYTAVEILRKQLKFSAESGPLDIEVRFPILQSTRHPSHAGYERVTVTVDTRGNKDIQISAPEQWPVMHMALLGPGGPSFFSLRNGQAVSLEPLFVSLDRQIDGY